MIQLTGAGKRYGPKILFEDLDWLVTPNERVGIVGANGTGKSSLLKVLAGSRDWIPDRMTTPRGVTVGYLPQDGLSLSGPHRVRRMHDRVRRICGTSKQEQETLAHRMAEIDPASAEYAQVAERFHRLESEFRARDGYTIEAQVGRRAQRPRLSARTTGSGARKSSPAAGRCASRSAKLLLEKPNLLLLDEPTNHLDLEARNWLEEYLTTYPNAFVLVSHDRYFLDVTVRKIVELWNKRVHFYTGGNYAVTRC